MVKGDSAWALLSNAGVTSGHTPAQDITGYLTVRQSQGFNAFVVAVPGGPNSGSINANGNTQDSIAPFTSPGVLNAAYWARVDYMLTQAAAYGFTVFMDVMFAQAVDQSPGPLLGWTDAQYTAYGTALGTRYGTTPNLVWFFGNDWNGDFATSYTD